ncbi:hypothetical protein M8C21_003092, partial [Ambrosia artemisiifolia]
MNQRLSIIIQHRINLQTSCYGTIVEEIQLEFPPSIVTGLLQFSVTQPTSALITNEFQARIRETEELNLADKSLDYIKDFAKILEKKLLIHSSPLRKGNVLVSIPNRICLQHWTRLLMHPSMLPIEIVT